MIVFLRGIMLFASLIFIAAACTVLLIKYFGCLEGFAAGVILFCVLASATVLLFNKFSDKKITNTDIMLPTIISIISAAVCWPLTFLQAEIFSTATCVASGVLLSIALYRLRNNMICKAAVITMFCTFLYEIAPINLPGDLDNFLSLGVSVAAPIVGKKDPEKLLENEDA